MTDLIVVTDYFVITNGTSTRQVQAISDEIILGMKRLEASCLGTEGTEGGGWVLLDYGEVVVHVFDRPTREFYDLEHLWADAKRVRWQRRTGRSDAESLRR